MTRKKTHQVYSNSMLPTCHEETGHEDYEDWIVRREELAEVYYGRRGMIYGRQQHHQGHQNHEVHRGTRRSNDKWEKNRKKNLLPQVNINLIDKNRREKDVRVKNEDKEDEINENVSKCRITEMINEQPQVEELSMWSCRKCTLDNLLTEKVCAACGGSRLCSIGDIDVPSLFRCDEVMKMIDKIEVPTVTFREKAIHEDVFDRNKRLSKMDEDEIIEAPTTSQKTSQMFSTRFLLVLAIYMSVFVLIFNLY